MRKINQKDYRYYVFNPKTQKLLSGWEYQEDARDHLKELSFPGLKVYTKTYLLRLGINPDLNTFWGVDLAGLKDSGKLDFPKVYAAFLHLKSQSDDTGKSDMERLELVSHELGIKVANYKSLLDQIVWRFSTSRLPSKIFPKSNKLQIENLLRSGHLIHPEPIESRLQDCKGDFDKSIKSLASIVAKNPLRPVMESVYVNAKDKQLVATDAHALVIVPFDVKGKEALIKPKRSKQPNPDYYMGRYERTEKGRFPLYKSVIPKKEMLSGSIDLPGMLARVKAIEKLSAFFDEKERFVVRFEMNDHLIFLAPALLEKTLRVLASQGSKKIRISLAKENPHIKPLLLESLDTKGLKAVIMPYQPGAEKDKSVYINFNLSALKTGSTKEHSPIRALQLRARAIEIQLKLAKY